MSEGTITIKKNDLYKYTTFLLAALVIVLVIVMMTGDKSVTGNVVANNPTAPSAPSAPTQPSQVSVSADDDPRWGDADAPVEIIEFSDFQCPFCGRALPTLEQIKAEYGDQVTIVYRDFPLESIHPEARPSAIAAECVHEAGGDELFWEYHDKLFANQQALNTANYKKWAQELGVDISDCVDNAEFSDEVTKDLQDGQAAGGRGTPYFVINGKPLSGAQPFSAFKQIIDAELA